MKGRKEKREEGSEDKQENGKGCKEREEGG